MPQLWMNCIIAVNSLMVPTLQYPGKAREVRSPTGKWCSLVQVLNRKILTTCACIG